MLLCREITLTVFCVKSTSYKKKKTEAHHSKVYFYDFGGWYICMSLCLLFVNNDLQCFVCGLGNIEQETAESKFVTKILFEKKIQLTSAYTLRQILANFRFILLLWNFKYHDSNSFSLCFPDELSSMGRGWGI